MTNIKTQPTIEKVKEHIDKPPPTWYNKNEKEVTMFIFALIVVFLIFLRGK